MITIIELSEDYDFEGHEFIESENDMEQFLACEQESEFLHEGEMIAYEFTQMVVVESTVISIYRGYLIRSHRVLDIFHFEVSPSRFVENELKKHVEGKFQSYEAVNNTPP